MSTTIKKRVVLSPRAKEALAAIKSAKWVPVKTTVIECADHGVGAVVNAKELDGAAPAEAARNADLLILPGKVCAYSPEAVAAAKRRLAKGVVVLPLNGILGYDGELRDNGVLSLGCQSHTIAKWARGVAAEWLDSGTSDVEAVPRLAEELKKKLAQLKARKERKAARTAR